MRTITSRATYLWTVAVCAVAALAVAFLCVPTARAVEASADTFTITVGGVEFNIPGDWHDMPLDDEDLDGLDELLADVDFDIDLYDDEFADLSDEDLDEYGLTEEDEAWLDELLGDDTDTIEYVGELEELLYTHNDGFIYILAEPDPDFATRTVEQLQASADNIYEMLDEYGINDIMDLQLQVWADLEQGYPTATIYTDNMVLNGVTYGLTIKLYAVDIEDFVGSVTSIMVMPTSGVTTENFGQSFPVVDTDTDVTFGSVTVTIPAGTSLIEASAFGYDVVIAYDSDGCYMLGLDIPGLSLGFSASDMPSLVMLLYMMMDLDDLGIEVTPCTFNGDGALGFDFIMDMSALGDSATEYIGIMVVFSEDSTEILAFYEPYDLNFSGSILQPLVDSGVLEMIDMSDMIDALAALDDTDVEVIDGEDIAVFDDEDVAVFDDDDVFVIEDIDIYDIDFSDIDLDDIDLDELLGALDEDAEGPDMGDLNIGHAA